MFNDVLLNGFRASRSTVTKERLKLLQLPSLELRRLHCDLIWCYKIVFGLVISFGLVRLSMDLLEAGLQYYSY